MIVPQKFVPVFEALKEAERELSRTNSCFYGFVISVVHHNAGAFDQVEFVNVHAEGIEILVGQEHCAALEQKLNKVFGCSFVTAESSIRSIGVAKITVFEVNPWLVTLITPIGLNLTAEIRMFEQLRAEYGIGEHLRAVLERRGVVPPLEKATELYEVPEALVGAGPELVGAMLRTGPFRE